MRDERLNNTTLIYDYKQNGVGTLTGTSGSNDWTDSQLMMMLNPTDYLKEGYKIDGSVVKDGNGQEIYQNMGSYYNGTAGCIPALITSGSNFSCTSIDFTSTGLKNDKTRSVIESVIWNIGGNDASNDTTDSMLYKNERGTTVYAGHSAIWTGKIGLIYSSDYGYATAGGILSNRSTCLEKEINSWNDSDVSECKNNDYLYKSSYSQWTLSPSSLSWQYVFYINSNGYIGSPYATRKTSVRPAAYLKPDVQLLGGNGSSTSPYQLFVQ